MTRTYTATVLALLTLFTLGCAGAKETAGIDDTEADIGASVIVVQTDGGAEEAYRSAAQVLQSNGFQIESSDATLRQITTTPKSSTDVIAPVDNLRLSIQVEESSETRIKVTGTYSDGYEVEKRGQSGSPTRKAWKTMHEVAAKMGAVSGYE
jgi:hypothetical protein